MVFESMVFPIATPAPVVSVASTSATTQTDYVFIEDPDPYSASRLPPPFCSADQAAIDWAAFLELAAAAEQRRIELAAELLLTNCATAAAMLGCKDQDEYWELVVQQHEAERLRSRLPPTSSAKFCYECEDKCGSFFSGTTG